MPRRMDLRMMRDMARGRRDYQRGSQGGSSRGGSRGDSRSSSSMGRNPYGSRGGRGRSMDYGYDYGYDYRRDYGMDYGEGSSMLDEEELNEWLEELMEDFDNREKQMFKEEKIMQRAKEMGIKFDHFTPKEYLVTAVMLYKDYKKTLGMANVDIYLKLAKDWLMDDDVEMKHGEKLAAYYDNVVMAD